MMLSFLNEKKGIDKIKIKHKEFPQPPKLPQKTKFTTFFSLFSLVGKEFA